MTSAPARSPAEAAAPGREAIAETLAAWGPALAGRAAEAVRAGLADRLRADAEEAFGGSPLTGDGFPLEVAASTADDRLRLVLEPGSRRLDPAGRLSAALAVAEAVSGARAAPEALDLARTLQASAGLRFGAWVGLRVGPDGTAAKLYAEVPPDAGSHPRLPHSPFGRAPPATLRMIGIPLGPGEVELYWRMPSPRPDEVPALLAPAGLDAEAPGLVAFLQDTYGHRFEDRLPGGSVGISLTSRNGRPSVTLHVFARALWGGDGRIRRSFGRLASQAACLGPYWRATAPLADRNVWNTRHGLLGVTPKDAGSPDLTLGFRPVARP